MTDRSLDLASCVASSGVEYAVCLAIDPGVWATCTPVSGPVIVLAVGDSCDGIVVTRPDGSKDSCDLAAYVTRWIT